MQHRRVISVITGKGYSYWVLLFIAAWFLIADFSHHSWMKDEGHRGVIKHDVIGYYGYLPAVFIYGDYKLEFIGEKGFVNDHRFLYLKKDNGTRMIQYTCGLSILYSPFFLMAHALAPALGETRDGYNWVYQFFLVMSALFYVMLGLILLRRLLLDFFNDRVVATVLVLLTLGTNLFYYTVYEGPMSHSYSFALIAILMFLVDRWYKSPSLGKTMLLGFVFGMIVLVRPTNIISLIIIVLWRVDSFGALKERIFFLVRRTPLVLLMILFFLIPWIPQFLYWKSLTGQFFYNSYDQVGSAFFFNAPQTHKMLFSYRKGWFVYAPMMLLSFISFIFLLKKYKPIFFVSLLYMAVMIYVLSSWWAWWFGGGYGSRAMVDTYAVMAFPLAAGIEWLSRQRRLAVKLPFIVVIIALLGLQLMQTKQYTKLSIHYVAMDKEAYWHNFFKIKKRGLWPFLSNPDHVLARLGIYYYYESGADYDAFREMPKDKAMNQIREEVSGDKKLMRSIHRHAKRNEISDEEAFRMVVQRIFEEKSERENLK